MPIDTCRWTRRETDTDGLFRFISRVNGYRSFMIVAEHKGQQTGQHNELLPLWRVHHPHTLRADGLLHGPLALPAGPDHPVQGYLYPRGPGGRQLPDPGRQVAHRGVQGLNGQEIARQQHTCNDYGSFSGSFTAPQDRALGTMSLQVESGPGGGTSFNVEEYKRPTFLVQLDPPADAPRLGSEVVVPGKAVAYTGVAIGGAQVKWRVVRQARFPIWCWWSRWYGASSTAQAIAYGSAVTESDGTFSVQFVAKPDLSIPETDEPTFDFQVYADVTDTAGETRSQQWTVRVGYTALQATISADEWQTPDVPVSLAIRTESIDGEPEPAQGDAPGPCPQTAGQGREGKPLVGLFYRHGHRAGCL